MLNEWDAFGSWGGSMTAALAPALETTASARTTLVPHQITDEMEEPVLPLQSEGSSRASGLIKSRMGKVLADTRDVGSGAPCQLGITSLRQFGAASMDPWAAINESRLRLVEKKHAQGLSLQESRELDRLNQEVDRHLESIDPRPTELLDEIDARLDRWIEELEAKRGRKV